MTEPELSKFAQVVQARKAEQAARKERSAPTAPAPPTGTQWDASLLPDTPGDPSEESTELDRILAGVSIVDAYVRWCGKMVPKVRPGQRESIMIRCPNPWHEDKNPDAWINLDKNVWVCGPCGFKGGDMFDIAANHFAIPDYKSGANFPELKRQMAQDLGYVVEKSVSPNTPDRVYLPDVPQPTLASVPEAPDAPEQTATVTELPLEIINDDIFLAPSFDWHTVVTEGTFLDTYMRLTTKDDAAEEYHFWNGMVAIALAGGRKKFLEDMRPVYGNIMTCIIGRSGDRKSRSIEHMITLLNEALPYNSAFCSGIMHLKDVASGEQMISSFDVPVIDPSTNKPIPGLRANVAGLFEYSELSDLTQRAMRIGSTIKSTLHQFADTKAVVSTASRTSGILMAERPFACLTTTTQPDLLKELLKEGDTKSGFLNRFIFVTGPSKQHVAIGGQTLDMTDAIDPLKKIYGQLDRTITWVGTEAGDLFTEYFHSKLEPAQQSDEMLGRIDLTIKKVILLLSLNEGLNTVTPEVVEKSMRLFGYLEAAYRMTGERVTRRHINSEIYETIVRHIKNLSQTTKKQYGPTKKDIKDRINRKGWDPKVIEQMFEIAKQDGHIACNMGDATKPGRKSEHFKWLAETS